LWHLCDSAGLYFIQFGWTQVGWGHSQKRVFSKWIQMGNSACLILTKNPIENIIIISGSKYYYCLFFWGDWGGGFEAPREEVWVGFLLEKWVNATGTQLLVANSCLCIWNSFNWLDRNVMKDSNCLMNDFQGACGNGTYSSCWKYFGVMITVMSPLF